MIDRLRSFSFADVNPLLLGVVSVIVTGAMLAGAFAVGTLGLLDDTYSMSATFEETGGIRAGDPVRVAGIEAGRVTGVTPDFDNGVVVITFDVDQGVDLGPMTTAEVSVATLLGGRFLRLGGPVATPYMADLPEAERQIPIERTRLPIGVQDALGQATRVVERIDAEAIDELLVATAQIAADNAEDFEPILDDVVALATVLNERRDQIDSLLAAASQLTDALADKDAVIDDLIVASADLLAEVALRRDQLRAILGDGSAAVVALDGIVRRNRDHLDALLADFDQTADVLARRLPELNEGLAFLGPTLTQLGHAGNSGPWLDAIVYGTGVVQLAALIDEAAGN